MYDTWTVLQLYYSNQSRVVLVLYRYKYMYFVLSTGTPYFYHVSTVQSAVFEQYNEYCTILSESRREYLKLLLFRTIQIIQICSDVFRYFRCIQISDIIQIYSDNVQILALLRSLDLSLTTNRVTQIEYIILCTNALKRCSERRNSVYNNLQQYN